MTPSATSSWIWDSEFPNDAGLWISTRHRNLYLTCHVDDFKIVCAALEDGEFVLNEMKERFEIKSLGRIQRYLGSECHLHPGWKRYRTVAGRIHNNSPRELRAARLQSCPYTSQRGIHNRRPTRFDNRFDRISARCRIPSVLSRSYETRHCPRGHSFGRTQYKADSQMLGRTSTHPSISKRYKTQGDYIPPERRPKVAPHLLFRFELG